MKIAVAGFQHETNSFAEAATSRSDFATPGGWPPFCAGAEMAATMPSSGTMMAGAWAVAAEQGAQLIPLLWCLGLPSGPVTRDAFNEIVDDICRRFAIAVQDGAQALYIDLHGAMVADGWADAEGEILARLRAIAPAPFPIAAGFDLHGNISEAMVRRLTLLDCYRTYPHTDLRETGARVMSRLIRHLRGEPAPALAFRAVPFLTALNDQCTFFEPTSGLLEAAALLAAADDVDCISQFFGFPLADVAEAGPSLVVQARTRQRAEAVADEMLARWIACEAMFATDLPDARTAVEHAKSLAAGVGTGPVIIADTQDNPGGGGTGDTTGMLQALLNAQATGAVVVHMADPAACEAAHRAGEGGTIDIAIGGAQSARYGEPVAGPWTVERLGSGQFTGVGPMYRGNAIDLGPVALVERAGVRVIVAPRKMQASEPGLLLHLGLEPGSVPILVLKSSVHFRGAYQTIAKAILLALAPGVVEADLSRLNYRFATRKPAKNTH